MFSTNGAFDIGMSLGLERTGPSSMAFDLAIFTEVVIYALNLEIIAVKQVLELLVFLSIQYLLYLFNSFLELLIVIGYDNYMEGLIILENVFLSFICPSTPHCYLAP